MYLFTWIDRRNICGPDSVMYNLCLHFLLVLVLLVLLLLFSSVCPFQVGHSWEFHFPQLFSPFFTENGPKENTFLKNVYKINTPVFNCTECSPWYHKDHNFLPLGFQLISLMNFAWYFKSKQPNVPFQIYLHKYTMRDLHSTEDSLDFNYTVT